MKLVLTGILFIANTDAFVPGWTSAVRSRPVAFNPTPNFHSQDREPESKMILFAKKANAKAAALEALEALESEEEELDRPLSKKERKEMEKRQKKAEKVSQAEESSSVEETEGPKNGAVGGKKNAKAAALEALEALEDDELDQPLSKKQQKALLFKQEKEQPADEKEVANGEPGQPSLSKKEEKLRKIMEMEEMDSTREESSQVDNQPALSKKELKALKKKEEKMAAKAAEKAEKKAQNIAEMSNMNDFVNESNGNSAGMERPAGETQALSKPTLEDKVRKERPPPRVRVMESAQPGFVSLRLEKVGITFRNQEVLKDVTWGVQSGDRIG